MGGQNICSLLGGFEKDDGEELYYINKTTNKCIKIASSDIPNKVTKVDKQACQYCTLCIREPFFRCKYPKRS